jgi:hypothetical protein
MSTEKKEAYLKKRRDNYHKRKAMMAASANEGLHLDSSISTPQIANDSTQSAQPMDVSQIVNTQLFRTPMDVSQKGSNQVFQSPTMKVSHITSTPTFRTPMDVSQKGSNQNFQSPAMKMSQIVSTPDLQTPMNVSQEGNNQNFHSSRLDVSQIAGKQMVQSPMETSQISYFGRNLLTSFQSVMGNPGKHLYARNPSSLLFHL